MPGKKFTSNVYARTTANVKKLNEQYTLEQMIETIDYIRDYKKVDMYSFGYIMAVIDDAQKEIQQIKYSATAEEEREKMKEYKSEVNINESTNNINKAARFGVQRRFGEKSNLHMFEES